MAGKEETIRQSRMQAQHENQQQEPLLQSPLRKDSAFPVSGKEEAFRAQVRMNDQRKNS